MSDAGFLKSLQGVLSGSFPAEGSQHANFSQAERPSPLSPVVGSPPLLCPASLQLPGLWVPPLTWLGGRMLPAGSPGLLMAALWGVYVVSFQKLLADVCLLLEHHLPLWHERRKIFFKKIFHYCACTIPLRLPLSFILHYCLAPLIMKPFRSRPRDLICPDFRADLNLASSCSLLKR